jgi:Gpi18-like mannosyltransferase
MNDRPHFNLNSSQRFVASNADILFVLAMWLLSRSVILMAMLAIAPALPTSPGSFVPSGWQVLANWDGRNYIGIATTGYDYANDGKSHNIAFFPVLPLLIWLAMQLGLSPDLAGILINNLAFLLALWLLYAWVATSHGKSAARWTIAALCCCPFSVFTATVYTEGLFLLLTTAALRAWDHQRYGQAAVWGAIASGTRLPGVVLLPTFLLLAWRERRDSVAYLSAIATSTGTILFSLFCWLRFNEPLAFLKAQQAWTPTTLAYGQGWLKMLVQITMGTRTWNRGRITDPLHFLLFIGICVAACLLWHFRKRLGEWLGYGWGLLGFLLWLLAGAPLVNFVMVWGGAYLLWHGRRELQPVALIYGVLSLVLILGTGRALSLERFAYAIVPIAIGFGLLLSRYPRQGYWVLGFFVLLLTSLSVRFAQHLWVG